MYTQVEGGADVMDALGGGLPDERTRGWLAQQSEALYQQVSDGARAFFEQSRALYQTVSESAAMAILRNLRGKSESVWDQSHVKALTNIAQLQTAGPIMQRWIMAQPDVRKRYLNQEVEGYGDAYTNVHGDVVGDKHFDYRRVMNGVVKIDEDDDTADFALQHFIDMLADDERELTVHEKIDILRTWDMVKHYLEEGEEDPTSPYGAML